MNKIEVVPAACGATFTHDMHVFKTPRGKIRACDGSIKPRR